MFVVFCFMVLACEVLAGPSITEEIWSSIFNGHPPQVDIPLLPAQLPYIGAYPHSHILAQQQLGYDVDTNHFGPVYYSQNNELCGNFNGAIKCNRYRVLKYTRPHSQEYDCVSFNEATNNTRYTPISYAGVFAAIIEKQYIGNYGDICNQGEVCVIAKDFNGNSVSYKGITAINQNACFIIRKYV